MCCKRDTSCGQESDVLEHMNSGFALCDKGIICVAWLLDCLSDALKQVLSVISLHPVHAKHELAYSGYARVCGKCDCEEKCLAYVSWYLV